MFVLVAPAHQQPIKNIEAVKKMIFWITIESLLEMLLMMLEYCSPDA